jgi:hypothetical protein
MRQIIAYKDENVEKIFSRDIGGQLLSEVRGKSKIAHFSIMSFDGGKNSVAETEEKGKVALEHLPNAWQLTCEWFLKK